MPRKRNHSTIIEQDVRVVSDAAATMNDDEEHEAVNWNERTIAALKAELERRGLPKSGKKVDLIARLKENVNQNPDSKEADHAITPKPKRAKKGASPHIQTEGPFASEVVEYKASNHITGERRLRPFVPEPDEGYNKRLNKIYKEKMFMLDRRMSEDGDGFPCETFDIAGSTGNLYTTTIGRKPRCDCMDARIRGQKCKHINYALVIILKAPAHMCYQLAFLSTEIQAIFLAAPLTRSPVLEDESDKEADCNGSRKPINGECPICVFDMEPGENLVWCKAACGQNFHKECFEQWRRSKRGGQVTCVYCRAKWQEDGQTPKEPVPGSLASLKGMAPKVGSYKNIGHLPMYQQLKD
ncbi:hypothetical protein B7494_g4884 [Chlorociboria aeruginascens]|nr:hypothetical protein B7494_g4884 [Chlorociboria aeruginascens]